MQTDSTNYMLNDIKNLFEKNGFSVTDNNELIKALTAQKIEYGRACILQFYAQCGQTRQSISHYFTYADQEMQKKIIECGCKPIQFEFAGSLNPINILKNEKNNTLAANIKINELKANHTFIKNGTIGQLWFNNLQLTKDLILNVKVGEQLFTQDELFGYFNVYDKLDNAHRFIKNIDFKIGDVFEIETNCKSLSSVDIYFSRVVIVDQDENLKSLQILT